MGIGLDAHKMQVSQTMRDDMLNILNGGIYKGLLLSMPDDCPTKADVANKTAYNIAKGLIESELVETLMDYIIGYIKDQMINIQAAPQTGLASPAGPVTGVVNVPYTFVSVS